MEWKGRGINGIIKISDSTEKSGDIGGFCEACSWRLAGRRERRARWQIQTERGRTPGTLSRR